MKTKSSVKSRIKTLPGDRVFISICRGKGKLTKKDKKILMEAARELLKKL